MKTIAYCVLKTIKMCFYSYKHSDVKKITRDRKKSPCSELITIFNRWMNNYKKGSESAVLPASYIVLSMTFHFPCFTPQTSSY